MHENSASEAELSADMPIKLRHSLTTQTLLQMGIRITLVVLAVSILSYWHIVQTLEQQTRDKLDNYIQERGAKESAIFELAQDNHDVFKQHFVYLVENAPAVSGPDFDTIFQSKADGTTRMQPKFYDGVADSSGMVVEHNSGYIGKEAQVSEQGFRNRLVYAHRLLDRFGPAWTTRFANVYASFPENAVIVHWPGFSWGTDATDDLNVHEEEWFYVANTTNNPGRGPVWTGLYYDQVADEWMVSCETPIDYQGEHLISVGHDYLLNDLFKRVFNDHLDGSYNFIFREDGRLIAHPDKVKELKKAGGKLKIQAMQDQELLHQYQQVMENVSADGLTHKVFFDEQNDGFMAVSKISGPGWWFVTVFPKHLLSSAARSTAEFILALSVVSLAVELMMLFLVLRFKVVQPLTMFVGASHAVKHGKYDQVASGELALPERRRDEVGSLARMLRSMAGTINSNIESLKQLDRLKDEFMANTSHELRTPLNGIVGIAESMLDGAVGKLSDEQRYNLSLIVTSGHRLTHLVGDILDFSRLKNHELTLQLKPVDLHALTEQVILFSCHSVDKTKVRLLNQVASDLPLVEADENRVQQILYNLVGNAIKFTNEGLICVTSRVWRDHVTIAVSDTGIGIADDKQQKIFESFEQGDGSDSREFGGTGLGLAVTKQLVELHKGRIKVVSCLDKGSEFSFTLPLVRQEVEPDKEWLAEQPESVVQIEALEVPAQGLDLSGQPLLPIEQNNHTTTAESLMDGAECRGRILAVDDEPINLQVLKNHLGLQKYVVETAANGKDALDTIKNSEPFDAILLDAMMPGMTGYEVCRNIRLQHTANQLPILMVTAKGGSEDMTACFEAGANDFLTKPVSKTELLERLKLHIALVNLSAELNDANGQLEQHAQMLERKVQQKSARLAAHGQQLKQTNQKLADVTEKASQSSMDIGMLEELGRSLTATLELNQVIKNIYRSLNSMLDAHCFMLGILTSDESEIHVPLIVEDSQKLAAVDFNMEAQDSPAVWCVKNRQELLIFEPADVAKYFDQPMAEPKRGKDMSTVIYLPLIIGDKIVGCLSVQHPEEQAFDSEQIDMLRTLASYSAIAIANASGYAKLADTHEALKETQKQLVLQEKMASLGTLTAGVAHEINNPTNFVSVGAENLQADLARFQSFILELAGDDADEEVVDGLKQEFVPLNEHIDTIINGTQRIKTIVQDLRSFTHLHSADKKPADIIDCLESTISLVKAKYKDTTEFVTEFSPLPKLVCYPAQLNQVFLNIIINACDAIEEKQRSQSGNQTRKTLGHISIICYFKDGNICISISDDGCGMSEHTRQQVFEPFYTTKEVGGGTGLGMAISFGIIEDHGGTISVKSVEGEGTAISVSLPFL